MKASAVAVVAAVIVVLILPGALPAQPEATMKARLGGFEEVPALSVPGSGEFRLKLGDGVIEFELGYAGLTGIPLAAHIHLGQRGVSGGVIAFLCGGPKPPCPAPPATVTGAIVAADIIGPAGQGIATGEFAEVLTAILARVTYANVHTVAFPGGEIRGQIE